MDSSDSDGCDELTAFPGENLVSLLELRSVTAMECPTMLHHEVNLLATPRLYGSTGLGLG